MRRLAIIPARGGSKRIPRKNIKDFLGLPIIAYSIRAALDSELFDEVMVSTDDEEIASVARRYGATVPFLRSAATSDDFATTADVLREVLDRYAEQGRTFDRLCCIYATAPFVTPRRLRKADRLLDGPFTSAFTCVRYSYPVQRALGIAPDGRIAMLHPEYALSRSQDLVPAYHDAGQFYFAEVEAFLQSGTLWGADTAPVVLPELEVQDLDTLTDWHIAEMKYSLLGFPRSLSTAGYRFVSYSDLSREESLRLLEYRNHPGIREWMIHTAPIEREAHLQFVDGLRFRRDCVYYAVYDRDGELVGSVNLHRLPDGAVERGIWIIPPRQGKGHAGRMLPALYKELFDTGRATSIVTRVLSGNEASIALEGKLGALPAGREMLEGERELLHFRLTPEGR